MEICRIQERRAAGFLLRQLNRPAWKCTARQPVLVGDSLEGADWSQMESETSDGAEWLLRAEQREVMGGRDQVSIRFE